MAEILFQGEPIHTIGELPSVGSQEPDFIVTKTDLSEIRLKNYLGHPILINIFPSLDTPTCASAMQRFNEIGLEASDILILCISADLPFAQKRFCAMQHLANVHPASVFRHPVFGQTYGVTILDGPLAGLLARAVLILDQKGKVLYTELVKEITEEPNYRAISQVLKNMRDSDHDELT